MEETPELTSMPQSDIEEEQRTYYGDDKEFEDYFHKFAELIGGNIEGFDKEKFDRFGENFIKAFYQQREVFKKGGEFGGIRFAACQTPAHDFDRHIRGAVITQMIMLPGFLAAMRRTGITTYSQRETEVALVGELLHDIGWLMREGDEEKYLWPGEKFFDHCQISATLAPKISQSLNFGFSEQENEMLAQIIRGTEFSPLEIDETEGRLATEERIQLLAELSWAADFLSYFSHPFDVPDVILDFYREAFARAKGERPALFLEENREEITLESFFTDEQLKHRLGQGIARVGELKFPSPETTGGIQNVQEFTAGTFLHDLFKVLKDYLVYSDYFFRETGEKHNWLRENYYINLARIETLQAIAEEFRPINPLCFLEGSLVEDDFIEWFENLRQNKKVQWQEEIDWEKFYQDFYNKNIDLKALGLGPYADRSFFERLVTSEIREFLEMVEPDSRVYAAADLLKVVKEKRRGGGAFKEIWLNLAPYTYTDNQGNEGSLLLPEKKWFEAIDIANKEGKGVELKLCFCLRREQYEMASRTNKDHFLGVVKGLIKEGRDVLVTIGGVENERNPLSRDEEFVGQLAKAGARVFVYAGRVPKPENFKEPEVQAAYKKLLRSNIWTAVRLAREPSVGKKIVVGLQGLCYLDDRVREEIVTAIINEKLPVTFSYTSDEYFGVIEDIADHPFAMIAGREEVDLKTLNSAVFMPHEFLPSNAPVEFFRLMRALELGRERQGLQTIEESALEFYRVSSEQESIKREAMIGKIRDDYLEIFKDIKLAGRNFFKNLESPTFQTST